MPGLVLARIGPWNINAAGYRSSPLYHKIGVPYAFKLAAALYYLTGDVYKKTTSGGIRYWCRLLSIEGSTNYTYSEL